MSSSIACSVCDRLHWVAARSTDSRRDPRTEFSPSPRDIAHQLPGLEIDSTCCWLPEIALRLMLASLVESAAMCRVRCTVNHDKPVHLRAEPVAPTDTVFADDLDEIGSRSSCDMLRRWVRQAA